MDGQPTALDDNKRLARAYFDAFRDRDAAWWDRFITPGFVRHDPGLDFEVRGPAGIRRLAEVMHGGLSDIAMSIDDVTAEGDRVLVRLRFSGRQTGEFMGHAATGRAVEIALMDYFRIADGRLAEHWALMDNLSMMSRSALCLPDRGSRSSRSHRQPNAMKISADVIADLTRLKAKAEALNRGASQERLLSGRLIQRAKARIGREAAVVMRP